MLVRLDPAKTTLIAVLLSSDLKRDLWPRNISKCVCVYTYDSYNILGWADEERGGLLQKLCGVTVKEQRSG